MSIVSFVQLLFTVLILLFAVLQKLEVVQATTVYCYIRDWEVPVASPSYPQAVVTWTSSCFLNTRNMAHLKFANPFGHKVLSLFHLSINQ